MVALIAQSLSTPGVTPLDSHRHVLPVTPLDLTLDSIYDPISTSHHLELSRYSTPLLLAHDSVFFFSHSII